MQLSFSGPDFDPPESEQYLNIAMGRQVAGLDTWLRDQGWFGPLGSATLLTAEEVRQQCARFLALPLDAPQLDISWIERGWCLKDEASDATFFGVGQGRWLAWNWFTTA
ncbi:hypothetical protein GCM10008955_24240 [Deinococcus malanensis]|uniref:Uncharacterized protein n=1 Tax=Deinococcus malanensis TaxID=1706855 RepID=A0ABQ2EWF7_9DEIO|nr:hypothetical protein [Deinococcus malanensis]GGK29595.1 hypothetical protein GCM10008955_24240 [Deinococcus malanensis]